jgi:hypothetical protein
MPILIINTYMEKTESVTPPAKKKLGGARPGSGRKKGSTNLISATMLLDSIKATSKKEYCDILAEDFERARNHPDANLAAKYHQLILNKVMTTLTSVEVTDSQANIDTKRAAFAAALAKMAELKQD